MTDYPQPVRSGEEGTRTPGGDRAKLLCSASINTAVVDNCEQATMEEYPHVRCKGDFPGFTDYLSRCSQVANMSIPRQRIVYPVR